MPHFRQQRGSRSDKESIGKLGKNTLVGRTELGRAAQRYEWTGRKLLGRKAKAVKDLRHCNVLVLLVIVPIGCKDHPEHIEFTAPFRTIFRVPRNY